MTLPVDNPAAQALGAKPLEPEQSRSLSGGLVISALRNLNVTLDVYRVKIADRVVVTENLGAFAPPPRMRPFGRFWPLAASRA